MGAVSDGHGALAPASKAPQRLSAASWEPLCRSPVLGDRRGTDRTSHEGPDPRALAPKAVKLPPAPACQRDRDVVCAC